MTPSVHVISPVAGFGNRLDLELLSDLLEKAGMRVTRTPVVDRGKISRSGRLAKVILSERQRFDVNIFLAPIFPEWLPMARRNILVPNAEGFAGHMHKYLPRIDLVAAKTRLTEQIFRDLGCNAVYTGFVSRDQLEEETPRDWTCFFHTCSSRLKGTKRLIELWQKHPEWPELVTVINHNDTIPVDISAANIRTIREPLEEAQIRKLQNSYTFHLCTSEAEGFGHYIMEAMSCRAVVLTSNAPPMNETVQPDRGLLIDCLPERVPVNLSHRYFFDPAALERQIERALQMTATEMVQLGSAARSYTLESNALFARNFPQLIYSVLR